MSTHPATTQTVAQGLIDAWNAHDLQAVSRYYAPAYFGVDVSSAAPLGSREDACLTAASYPRLSPTCSCTSTTWIVHDEQATVVWTATGTHQGAFMHIPATRKPFTLRGVSVFTVADGLVERGLQMWDVAGLLCSIGLLPEF